MYPSICLVCDPDPRAAPARVARMLSCAGAADAAGVRAAAGRDWAAAVVPPSASETTCGADIYHDGPDVLLWTGEVFFPDGVNLTVADERPARTISRRLLDGLRRQGVESLAALDGGFCGAWFDGRSQAWTVFNDKLGLLPVFWLLDGRRLIVGPRASLVAQVAGRPLEIDERGVADLLRTQNMADDHTLIRGVHWLKRRHALRWRPAGGYSCVPVWDMTYAAAAPQSDEQAIDAYLEALTASLRRHTTCTGPLLLGVSGGLDSRIFLAICRELNRVPDCFTVGFPFANDVRFGRRLARLAGAGHEWMPLEEVSLPGLLVRTIIETDGLLSVAHLAPAAAARDYLLAHRGAVLLEGFFNGMMGGTTVPAPEDAGDDKPAHQRRWAKNMLHAGGSFELIDDLLEPRLADESRMRWRTAVDDAYTHAPFDDPLQKVEYALTGSRLGRIDTLGTALQRHDVLVRNPATDTAMLRWHLTTPARLRRGRRLYPLLLSRRFPRFARVSRSENGGLPVTNSRFWREYCWQREKLYRLWAGRHYPVLRQWGADGAAIRAWTLETWRASGGLDVLREPGARILQWVHGPALLGLWNRAQQDPLQGIPLLGLATIEIMVRWLEANPPFVDFESPPAVRFEVVNADSLPCSRPAEVSP